MSIKVMTWVWDHSPYKDDALLIHLALADWANDEGMCWPKQTSIASKARCSVEHVRRVTKRMQEDGYIEIVKVSRGPGSSHKYLMKNPTNGGVSTSENPTTTGVEPHIEEANTPHPSPKNHQEPPLEPIVTVPCPYCRKKFVWGKPHDCPTMNQRLR